LKCFCSNNRAGHDLTGYSGEIDHHSALKPITIPEESDQASERSDAGFSIFPEGDRFRQV